MTLQQLGRFGDQLAQPQAGRKQRIWSDGVPKPILDFAPSVVLRSADAVDGMSIEQMLGTLPLDAQASQDPRAYLAAMSAYGYTPAMGIGFREFIARTGLSRIERKLRVKSPLDAAFFHATQACLGEAFRFAEFSKNRRILCLDVNSMFPWILKTARFPNASRLQHDQGPDLLVRLTSGQLDNGMFRTRVTYRAEHREFLNRFAPLFFGFEGGSLPVAQAEGEVFEVWLQHEELLALLPYCDLQVLEGVYSPESIEHPLAAWVDRFYARKRSTDPVEKTVAKAALTTLHTCASRVSSQRLTLTPETLEAEFQKRFLAKPFVSGRYAQPLTDPTEERQRWQLYRHDNAANVYSLAATVYGAARARMFSLIAAIEAIDGASVSYTNIDSLHVSVTPEANTKVLACVDRMRGVGSGLGQMKLEASGDTALWLDAGVYWIGDGSRLVKHASLSQDPQQAFSTKHPFTAIDPFTGLEYQGFTHLFKSLSTAKRLEGNRWVRLTANEIRLGATEHALRRVDEIDRIRPTFDKLRHTLTQL